MTTTTSSPSAVIAVAEPGFTSAGHLVLAGFLAGYAGLTRRLPPPATLTRPSRRDALIVIGRQVSEGTPKYRSVLRGAASQRRLARGYRDTGFLPDGCAGEIQRRSSAVS